MNTNNELKDAAIGYARRGWKVFPLHTPNEAMGFRCSCGKQDCKAVGKHPRVIWTQAATTDVNIVSTWWDKWPDANIGIATGAESGLVVVDFDGEVGLASLRRLTEDHGFTDEALIAETGNGFHMYFHHPGGDVLNSARTVADGVDVRGDGGYVVAPPSLHKNGHRYRWRDQTHLVVNLPPSLHAKLCAKNKTDKNQHESGMFEAVPEGRRNTHLTSEAGRLRRGGKSAEEITSTLLEINSKVCSPPLAEDEVRQVAQSVARYPSGNGASRPQSSEETQSQKLMRLANRASLFHSPKGESYASLDDSGKRNNWRINSLDFKNWLIHQYWRESGSAVSSSSLMEVLATLDARARFEGEVFPVFNRVAEYEGKIYLDLADTDRNVIEVTSAGWSLTTASPVRFVRCKNMKPLQIPVSGGSLDELRPFVNVEADGDWMPLVSWLLASLRATGPYPLAILLGEQGSAKSTTARVLREVVDPCIAPIRCEPREVRDLMIAATNGWVMCFDNLSKVEPWLSDALCRMSTGGGFGTRTLYSDADETVIEAQRPVILTGIENLASQGDLLDRSLIMYMPSIPEEERIAERQLWESFTEAHPRILGALLDAVSCALRELPNVKLRKLPRMADFALWVSAAESSLGWEPGAFIKAYEANRTDANNVALDASLLSGPLISFAAEGTWSGTAEQLLNQLTGRADENTRRSHLWPKTARGMGGVLRRLAPNLRQRGINVTFDRDTTRERKRIITIDRPKPSEPSALEQ
jgi:Bifunctional DNA primase/polymerase, N-terminal/Primase C terminal 1 (PriCT-1)